MYNLRLFMHNKLVIIELMMVMAHSHPCYMCHRGSGGTTCWDSICLYCHITHSPYKTVCINNYNSKTVYFMSAIFQRLILCLLLFYFYVIAILPSYNTLHTNTNTVYNTSLKGHSIDCAVSSSF